MSIGVVIVGILALWLLSYNNASSIKFTNFVCENYNESWILVNECRLKAINRNKTIVNFNATVLHPVYNLGLEGRFLKKENGYKPWLYKFSIDVCKFIKKPYKPIAIMLFKIVQNYTNVNHTCPYVGPQIINGFYTKYELFGLPLPSGEFLMEIDWCFDHKRHKRFQQKLTQWSTKAFKMFNHAQIM